MVKLPRCQQVATGKMPPLKATKLRMLHLKMVAIRTLLPVHPNRSQLPKAVPLKAHSHRTTRRLVVIKQVALRSTTQRLVSVPGQVTPIPTASAATGLMTVKLHLSKVQLNPKKRRATKLRTLHLKMVAIHLRLVATPMRLPVHLSSKPLPRRVPSKAHSHRTIRLSRVTRQEELRSTMKLPTSVRVKATPIPTA